MRQCILLVLVVLLSQCQPDLSYEPKVADATYLDRALAKLTDVIVYDIFSPPQASRIYAYPSIAAYEVLQHKSEQHPSLAGQLRALDVGPAPPTDKCNLDIAAFQAFAIVGRALIFSEAKMDEFIEGIHQEYLSHGASKSVLRNSIAYGEAMADHILAWADEDNYKQTRTFPKFEIRDEPSRWQPTPPDYMEGIEPSWNQIRPFVIDSAEQFTPPLPTTFDMTQGSPFYQEVLEVYDAVRNLDEERTAIAQFWDCNPYVSHHKGHVMFATKKITPGGHWMGISQIAARKANSDMLKTAMTYAYTSIALADGFISCWDEKYRSNLIRPETLINQHIDEDWVPLLQTPPFPEYTSGHSVISSAAAVMLTAIYGENFQFDDTVELAYGLPVRSFESFLDASSEAAISRLYGGIHYMPAITNGVTQGRKLGAYVAAKLNFPSS